MQHCVGFAYFAYGCVSSRSTIIKLCIKPLTCLTCRKPLFCFTNFTNDHGYVQFVLITIRSVPHLWISTAVVRKETCVEQELLTPVEHTSSPLDCSWVRVPPSSDFCVVFCRFSFSVGQCVVCPNSIYDYWLLLCYLQATSSVI
jgi:hypothetical protein